MRKYGITEIVYFNLLASQGFRCPICHTLDPGPKGWAIDHDHRCCNEPAKSCGQCVRGILCQKCNLAIGLLKDDASVLLRASQWLKRPSINACEFDYVIEFCAVGPFEEAAA